MYKLPELKYGYNELEPYIDAQTVELHYSKHHQWYVDGLNATLSKLEKARETNDFSTIKHLKRELAFHGSGHILHSIYWDNMAPNWVKLENWELMQKIISDFGSYENFEAEFKQTATTVEWSGWAILAVNNEWDLQIFAAEKHQDLTIWWVKPILACDVWEHSYYLKYQNRRAEYIENFFKVIDWKNVEENYLKNI